MTKTYSVSAAAVDLHGNQDPTPVTTSVTVDGRLPKLTLKEYPKGPVDQEAVRLAWTAEDDHTATSRLITTVQLYRLVGSEQEFVSLESAHVSVAVLPLLRGAAVVDGVRVAGLKANVVKDKQGKFNFDDLLQGDAGKPPAPSPGRREAGAARRWRSTSPRSGSSARR